MLVDTTNVFWLNIRKKCVKRMMKFMNESTYFHPYSEILWATDRKHLDILTRPLNDTVKRAIRFTLSSDMLIGRI